MASVLVKKAGRSILAKHLASLEPSDPLYENVEDSGGKSKRVRRKAPDGLSKRDRKILKKVKKRAHYLDKGMNLCGLRVGWTFWIGIIPGAGDIANILLNYTLVVRQAKKAEIPGWLLSQMLTHNTVSGVVGFIPFAGDLVVAVYKANSRNAHLLEEYLSIRGQEYLISQGIQITNASSSVKPGVTMNDPALKEQYKPGAGMAPGEVIAAPGQEPDRGGRGWFGFGKKNKQQQSSQSPSGTATPPPAAGHPGAPPMAHPAAPPPVAAQSGSAAAPVGALNAQGRTQAYA